jgi:ABC-type nitrate/sulfonate/bicarbonate transport system substrate-binding protein
MGIWLEENGVKFDEVKYTNVIMDDAVAAMVSGKVAAKITMPASPSQSPRFSALASFIAAASS